MFKSETNTHYTKKNNNHIYNKLLRNKFPMEMNIYLQNKFNIMNTNSFLHNFFN